MKKELIAQEKELLHKIKGETNIDTQIWAARSIANVFDILRLEYPRNRKNRHHHLLQKTFYKNTNILL